MTIAGRTTDHLLCSIDGGTFAQEGRAMTSQGQEVPADGGLRQLSLEMRTELRRFLMARGVREADAEDVLQDMFIRLQSAETGPIRSPRAYLYQMANNMAHTLRRAEGRRQARDASWIGPDDADERIDDAPDPETVTLARDQLARVEAQLDRLPERTAHVFRQFRIEGASQKAIALDLGISLSAVEKHLQRAYRAILDIRGRLGGQMGPQGHDGTKGGFDDLSR